MFIGSQSVSQSGGHTNGHLRPLLTPIVYCLLSIVLPLFLPSEEYHKEIAMPTRSDSAYPMPIAIIGIKIICECTGGLGCNSAVIGIILYSCQFSTVFYPERGTLDKVRQSARRR